MPVSRCSWARIARSSCVSSIMSNNADVAQIGYTALRRTGTSIDIAQGASLDDFDEEHLQTLKAEYEQTALLLDE